MSTERDGDCLGAGRDVELGNTASHKLGIDWSMLGGMTGSAALGGGIQTTRLGSGVNDYTRQITGKTEYNSYSVSGTGSHDGDINYFNGTLSFSEMSLTLKALESTEDAKVFSNPKIIVSTGKKATVDMTTKYPSVLVSAKRTLNGNAESLDLRPLEEQARDPLRKARKDGSTLYDNLKDYIPFKRDPNYKGMSESAGSSAEGGAPEARSDAGEESTAPSSQDGHPGG